MLQGIRAKLSQAFLQGPMDESLSDGIGSSYGIIHYRGKNWSLSYRGATHLFTRPDDGSPASYIDVVILRQARNKSKSFYEGFDQDAANKRPICSALDGERPDPDAQTPQATACAVCPRNVWKTDQHGRRTKECSDYKRVAVLLLPSTSARMFNGVPLVEPVFLRVPAASLADLASFGDQLVQAGIPYWGIVTRVSFDPTKAHPQMQFRPLQGLTDAEAPVVLPLRDDNITKRIVGEDQPRPIMIPQGAQQPQVQQGPQQVIPPQGVPQPMTMVPTPQPQPTFVAPAPPPAQQPIVMQSPVLPETVATGFGPAPIADAALPTPNLSGLAQPTPAPIPASDVGAAQEADAVLDGRLASLFPTAGA
jgi:hypothetical protein